MSKTMSRLMTISPEAAIALDRAASLTANDSDYKTPRRFRSHAIWIVNLAIQRFCEALIMNGGPCKESNRLDRNCIVELRLPNKEEKAIHEVMFNATNLPSGFYLYRLETPVGRLTRGMLLVN